MYVPRNTSAGLRANFYLAATWAWLGFRLVELKVLRPLVRNHALASSGSRSVSSTGSTTSTQTRQRANRATVDPTQARFQIRKFSDGSCGAEVSGVNLSDMTRAQHRTITRALEENSVLVFQGQTTLGPRRQIGLSQRWGDIVSSRFLPQLPDFPEVTMVTEEELDTQLVFNRWHHQHSCNSIPVHYTFMLARELPEPGLQTWFADMCAAFDALSDGLKQVLSSLNVVHSTARMAQLSSRGAHQSDGPAMADQPCPDAEVVIQEAVGGVEVAHPVVIVHPGSGRRALYINELFTVRFEGWSAEESQPLLAFLFQHSTQARFVTKVHWREGMLVMWDHLRAMHLTRCGGGSEDVRAAPCLMHCTHVAAGPLAGAHGASSSA
mmetsp:Transcript_3101/g.6454  ORF Transcript_3101/g.6454 Transcript_3101/m.6454 type:complete len:380 (+) Transcript_3101:246-1385(+)